MFHFIARLCDTSRRFRDCSEFLGVVLFGKSALKKRIPPLGDSVKNGYPPSVKEDFQGSRGGQIAQNQHGESPPLQEILNSPLYLTLPFHGQIIHLCEEMITRWPKVEKWPNVPHSPLCKNVM